MLREELVPLADGAVRAGNKVFGAAILLRDSLELVVAGANDEVANPLLHGEISCLNRYWALPRGRRPAPRECLFLSSHEPCSLCLSAITWSGFDNFYFLFSYEDTRDEFEIPHDLRIMAEVFRCPDGAYAASNAYWRSYYLLDLIEQAGHDERARWREQVADLRAVYADLSAEYQRSKEHSDIPLA